MGWVCMTVWWRHWRWGACSPSAAPSSGFSMSTKGTATFCVWLFHRKACLCWESTCASYHGPQSCGRIEFTAFMQCWDFSYFPIAPSVFTYTCTHIHTTHQGLDWWSKTYTDMNTCAHCATGLEPMIELRGAVTTEAHPIFFPPPKVDLKQSMFASAYIYRSRKITL